MVQEVSLPSHTTVDWASFCRQVCIDAVITKVQPIGGPGKIVETICQTPRDGHFKFTLTTCIFLFRVKNCELSSLEAKHRLAAAGPVPLKVLELRSPDVRQNRSRGRKMNK